MGGLKLCYAGYTYIKKAVSTNSIRWECSEKKGRIYVVAISTNPDIDAVTGSKKEHSHPPCETTKNVMKLRLEINERLMNLCQDRVSNVKNLEQFLTGVGHCIRLK